MMKRIASSVVSILLAFALFLPMSVEADYLSTKHTEIIYLENGCHIIVETNIIEDRSSTVKRGNRSYIYRNNNGDEQWRATLYGTWSYDGSTAVCTASSSSTSITNTAWYQISNATSKSGASATAEVTMGQRILGITINKETLSMRLTCDANGNLS